MTEIGIFELLVVMLFWILHSYPRTCFEVSGAHLENAIVANGSNDEGFDGGGLDLGRTLEKSMKNASGRINGGKRVSSEVGEKVGVVPLLRETKHRYDVSQRIRRRRPHPSEIFISKKESYSFLRRNRVRREFVKNPGHHTPLGDLTSDKFKEFRYGFPERTEWFPEFENVWDMCVYKKGRKYEGITGPNWKRKWCKWEEVWEIHKNNHRKGFTFEFASAIMSYINCLREDDPVIKEADCPKPCSKNPCTGPHMDRCQETGITVTKSFTCICHNGWVYNAQSEQCIDQDVCGTIREQCNKANTIECVEKAGFHHECICDRRWMGPRCEKPYDACVDYDNPCGQYGTCSAHPGQRTWTCKCMDGWGDDPKQEGRDCKRQNQVCDDIVCLNGGECQASRSQSKARCICSEEWTGELCGDPKPTWTMWQPWGKCSVTCGYDGTRVRVRDCDHKEAVYCGPGTDEEHAVCNGPVCMVDGEWSEWVKVTDCSYNCGGGHFIKARNCEYDTDDPEAFGEPCEGRAIEYADCNIMSCPKSEKRWLRIDINSLARTIVSQTEMVAGDWGAWNSWTDCSTTCDVGFRSRNRICLSSIGACQGSSEEIEDCTVKNCDKEAGLLGWGTWTYWTKCKPDEDFCYRYRECPYSVQEEDFQEACPGKSSQSVPCEADGCGELQVDERPVKEEQSQSQDESQKEAEGQEQSKKFEEEKRLYAAPAPPVFQGYQHPGHQYVVEPIRPSNHRADRAAAAGESSALGLGSVAALATIAYMGKVLFTKFKKKRKLQRAKKKQVQGTV